MSQIRENALAQPAGSPVEGEKTELLIKPDATQLLADGGPAATWQSPVAIDSVLAGRFKLVQLIGEGGMSNVYKAVDLRKVEAGARDPHLAVKVLTVSLQRSIQLAGGDAPGGEQAADAHAPQHRARLRLRSRWPDRAS